MPSGHVARLFLPLGWQAPLTSPATPAGLPPPAQACCRPHSQGLDIYLLQHADSQGGPAPSPRLSATEYAAPVLWLPEEPGAAVSTTCGATPSPSPSPPPPPQRACSSTRYLPRHPAGPDASRIALFGVQRVRWGSRWTDVPTSVAVEPVGPTWRPSNLHHLHLQVFLYDQRAWRQVAVTEAGAVLGAHAEGGCESLEADDDAPLPLRLALRPRGNPGLRDPGLIVVPPPPATAAPPPPPPSAGAGAGTAAAAAGAPGPAGGGEPLPLQPQQPTLAVWALRRAAASVAQHSATARHVQHIVSCVGLMYDLYGSRRQPSRAAAAGGSGAAASSWGGCRTPPNAADPAAAGGGRAGSRHVSPTRVGPASPRLHPRSKATKSPGPGRVVGLRPHHGNGNGAAASTQGPGALRAPGFVRESSVPSPGGGGGGGGGSGGSNAACGSEDEAAPAAPAAAPLRGRAAVAAACLVLSLLLQLMAGPAVAAAVWRRRAALMAATEAAAAAAERVLTEQYDWLMTATPAGVKLHAELSALLGTAAHANLRAAAAAARWGWPRGGAAAVGLLAVGSALGGVGGGLAVAHDLLLAASLPLALQAALSAALLRRHLAWLTTAWRLMRGRQGLTRRQGRGRGSHSGHSDSGSQGSGNSEPPQSPPPGGAAPSASAPPAASGVAGPEATSAAATATAEAALAAAAAPGSECRPPLSFAAGLSHRSSKQRQHPQQWPPPLPQGRGSPQRPPPPGLAAGHSGGGGSDCAAAAASGARRRGAISGLLPLGALLRPLGAAAAGAGAGAGARARLEGRGRDRGRERSPDAGQGPLLPISRLESLLGLAPDPGSDDEVVVEQLIVGTLLLVPLLALLPTAAAWRLLALAAWGAPAAVRLGLAVAAVALRDNALLALAWRGLQPLGFAGPDVMVHCVSAGQAAAGGTPAAAAALEEPVAAPCGPESPRHVPARGEAGSSPTAVEEDAGGVVVFAVEPLPLPWGSVAGTWLARGWRGGWGPATAGAVDAGGGGKPQRKQGGGKAAGGGGMVATLRWLCGGVGGRAS